MRKLRKANKSKHKSPNNNNIHSCFLLIYYNYKSLIFTPVQVDLQFRENNAFDEET